MRTLRIKDKRGRILLETRGDRCIISRFIETDSKTKESIADLYVDLTGSNRAKVIAFLSFKSDNQEFCS